SPPAKDGSSRVARLMSALDSSLRESADRTSAHADRAGGA
ncbi:exonuclease SbcC, partial [Streptomyces sp. SID8380]|nr:exonuclease SbcC [Streptomyces sp. SID8380]